MELILPAADDLHVHLRNDERTPKAIEATRHGGACRVMAMPNTVPAIHNGDSAESYRDYLVGLGADFEILTTVKLSRNTTAEDLENAADKGVTAIKQYPMGVTTNSDDGVRDTRSLFPLYEVIQDRDLVLSLHGEVPGVFVMDAEAAFLKYLEEIHQNFPKLRIVLEHITTKESVALIRSLPEQVAATITDHHLELTLDDVVGNGRIQPHHFCMPVAKRPVDREALFEVVREGHPSFFSGTDTAPHKREDKECASGCAGIFNAPFHMQFLATRFEEWGILDRLQAFTSRFGAEFYRLEPNKQEIVLEKKSFRVPDSFGAMVPFPNGQTLNFALSWL